MLTVYILIVFSTYQNSGVGFSHTFYDRASCEAAAQTIEKGVWGNAFCVPDVKPKAEGE